MFNKRTNTDTSVEVVVAVIAYLYLYHLMPSAYDHYYYEFDPSLLGGVLYTTLYEKVCH